MLVIPAIDIRNGRCVRLLQGDVKRELVYDDDPVEVARRWIGMGARWLHVVDLDGAFAGRPVRLDLLRAIAASGVPVQAGGGFRTIEDIDAGLAAGAARIIIGTAAASLGSRVGRRDGERVAVSLDVRGGRIAVKGWTVQRNQDAVSVAKDLTAQGIGRFIYTEITRDGMLAGPDLRGLRSFVRAIDAPVIAAGGVASLADIEALDRIGVEGVIVGRALYEGRIDLVAATTRWSASPC